MESRRTGPDNDGPDRRGRSQAAQKLAEPITLQEVASELTKRGLTAATGQPDVTVTYYLLLTTSINAQTVGQFLPATLDWGYRHFPGHTGAQGHERRVARTRFHLQERHRLARRRPGGAQNGREPKKREAVLREAIRDCCEVSAEVKTPPSSGEGEVMTIRTPGLESASGNQALSGTAVLAGVSAFAAACSQPDTPQTSAATRPRRQRRSPRPLPQRQPTTSAATPAGAPAPAAAPQPGAAGTTGGGSTPRQTAAPRLPAAAAAGEPAAPAPAPKPSRPRAEVSRGHDSCRNRPQHQRAEHARLEDQRGRRPVRGALAEPVVVSGQTGAAERHRDQRHGHRSEGVGRVKGKASIAFRSSGCGSKREHSGSRLPA